MRWMRPATLAGSPSIRRICPTAPPPPWRRATPFSKHLFHDEVLRHRPPQVPVCFLSPVILALNVQPDSGRLAAARFSAHVLVQCLEYSLPPKIRSNVHALNPPKITIPPIAPLVRDHQLPGDLSVDLGQV